MPYLVARHAPGGLAYLTDESTWVRRRCCAERYDDKGLAAAIARDFNAMLGGGVHVRDDYRHELTCRPVGRPRAIA